MPSFTKQVIIASFLKLLNERPLAQITIKDIVEDCGINRNSFYYHFKDLPTLVKTILIEEADRIINEHAKVHSLEECLALVIEFAQENKKAVLHIYRSGNRADYERYLGQICRHAVEEYIKTVAGDIPVQPEDKELIIEYFKRELVGYVLDWMADGMRYDIASQTRRLCELFAGAARMAFERSAGIAPLAPPETSRP